MIDRKEKPQETLEVFEGLLILSDAVQSILLDEEKPIEYRAKVRSAYMIVEEDVMEGRAAV